MSRNKQTNKIPTNLNLVRRDFYSRGLLQEKENDFATGRGISVIGRGTIAIGRGGLLQLGE